ncbi:MAG: tryptophan synthase subunit alpha [Planctomycetota bacterium]
MGFGISGPEHAATVARAGADGVIIGSRIVGLIESHLGDREGTLAQISIFLAEVRAAI